MERRIVERVGISRFVVGRCLNQISDAGGAAAVTAIYDRNEYLAERQKARDAWGRRCWAKSLGGKKRSANAFPLSRGGRASAQCCTRRPGEGKRRAARRCPHRQLSLWRRQNDPVGVL